MVAKLKLIPQIQKPDFAIPLIISILAGIIFFAGLGSFSLFNPDEGLYAEPAREMLDTGEYITTTLNYDVRFTKPPLVIWMMALAYKIWGVNEFAARIFCASSAFLLILITYFFCNKYLDRRTAIFAPCILLTAPLFIGVGRMAITDMPLSLFMAGSIFSFFHGWKQKRKLWLYTSYILIAFSVMTKGPVGLLLPALILLVFFYLCSSTKETIKSFVLPAGLSLVALLALPWFILEIAITHGAYFQEFIMRENFARFTSVVDAHKGPWFYHILAVCGGLFPWSILLPQAFFTSLKNISGSIKKQSGNFLYAWNNCARDLDNENQVLLLSLVFSITTILFFSVSVSKLLPYTLPCFPALAIIIANQWTGFIKQNNRKSAVIYTAIIFLFALAAVLICPFALHYLRNAPPLLPKLIFQYSGLLSLATFCSIMAASRKHLFAAAIILFGTMTISSSLFLPQFLAVVNDYWEADLRQYAKLARFSKKPLIVYRLRKPGTPFYYGKKVIQLNSKEDLSMTTKQLKACYLITCNKYISDSKAAGFKVLSERNNLVLLNKEDK